MDVACIKEPVLRRGRDQREVSKTDPLPAPPPLASWLISPTQSTNETLARSGSSFQITALELILPELDALIRRIPRSEEAEEPNLSRQRNNLGEANQDILLQACVFASKIKDPCARLACWSPNLKVQMSQTWNMWPLQKEKKATIY